MGFLSKIFKGGSMLVVVLAVLCGLLVNGNLARWGVIAWLGSLSPEWVGMGPAFMTAEQLSTQWDYSDIPEGSLEGKVAVVTGANVGLGYYTSLHLASKGATVVMACRTMSKCDKSAQELRAMLTRGGTGSVEIMHIDTSSLASVQTFAASFIAKFDRLDVLVCNAGIAVPNPERPLSSDGIEAVFATNHLGHFLLFRDVRALMEATADKHGHARVVHVSSAAHYSTDKVGVHTNLADLNEKTKSAAYGQSKLCNVLFSNEIAAQAEAKGDLLLSNSLHPGAVDTNIWVQVIAFVERSLPSPLFPYVLALIQRVRAEAMWTSEQGARTQVYLAAAPEVLQQGITGKYFHPVTTQNPINPVATLTLQRALWEFSEQLLKQKGF